MKTAFSLLCFLCFSLSILAQSPATGTVYGLEFTSSQLRLASANPITGAVQVISQAPTSSDQFGSGNSDIDPVNNVYYYVRAGQIITVDLLTGNVVHNPAITCSTHNFSFVQPISNIAYNWADGTIYGLLHYNSQLWFAKVDPASGVMTVLSNGPVSPDQYASGVADIDPVNGRYFYVRANSIYTIDIATATATSFPALSDPFNATGPITNIAYDWLTDVLYGLNYVGAVWNNNTNTLTPGMLRLASVDILTGHVTILSQSVLSQDQFESGVSDIDPAGGVYYYVRNKRLYTVDISTGDKLFDQGLSNSSAISPLTNLAVYKDIYAKPDPIGAFIEQHHDLTINFQNTSAFGRHMHWDFGDGHSSTERHPQHEYEAPGVYVVTLIVENMDGKTHEITKAVEVRDAIPVNPYSPGLNQQVNFLDESADETTDDLNLSVEEFDATSIAIYPQPAIDEVTIQLDGPQANYELRCFTLTGQVVHSELIQVGMQTVVLDQLGAGQYLYQITRGVETVKRGRLVLID